MLKKPSPRAKKRASSAENVASALRHELRNKFASIQNAVTYIERSLEKMQLLERDPRIARFLALIGDELGAADGLLDQRARNEKRRGPSSSRALER